MLPSQITRLTTLCGCGSTRPHGTSCHMQSRRHSLLLWKLCLDLAIISLMPGSHAGLPFSAASTKHAHAGIIVRSSSYLCITKLPVARCCVRLCGNDHDRLYTLMPWMIQAVDTSSQHDFLERVGTSSHIQCASCSIRLHQMLPSSKLIVWFVLEPLLWIGSGKSTNKHLVCLYMCLNAKRLCTVLPGC